MGSAFERIARPGVTKLTGKNLSISPRERSGDITGDANRYVGRKGSSLYAGPVEVKRAPL